MQVAPCGVFKVAWKSCWAEVVTIEAKIWLQVGGQVFELVAWLCKLDVETL